MSRHKPTANMLLICTDETLLSMREAKKDQLIKDRSRLAKIEHEIKKRNLSTGPVAVKGADKCLSN